MRKKQQWRPHRQSYISLLPIFLLILLPACGGANGPRAQATSPTLAQATLPTLVRVIPTLVPATHSPLASATASPASATASPLASATASPAPTTSSPLAQAPPAAPSPLAQAPSPPSAPPQGRIANTDLNPYGVNVFLGQEVEEVKRDRTLALIAAAHIGWIKQEFTWEEIEEPGKGQFYDTRFNKSTWQKWDNIVALAEKHHLNIIARLDRPPAWARSDQADPEAPPARYSDYADFVSIFVTHYKGRIHYIQIWNEPNIYPEWGSNASPNAAQYVELLKQAYQAAKQADPSIFVTAAPLAETLEESNRNLSELKYLQQMYDAGAKPYFDIMTANAYGLSHPPSDPPNEKVLNFQRVILVHDIMVKNGDGAKAVWFNEFGWNASPTNNTVDPKTAIWSHVTLEEQARFTVEAIRLARSQWPWVGVANIWYFRQPGNRYPPSDSAYYFQMVTPDFALEPIYIAIRDLASQNLVARSR